MVDITVIEQIHCFEGIIIKDTHTHMCSQVIGAGPEQSKPWPSFGTWDQACVFHAPGLKCFGPGLSLARSAT